MVLKSRAAWNMWCTTSTSNHITHTHTHSRAALSYPVTAAVIKAWCCVEVRAWGSAFTRGAGGSDETGRGSGEAAARLRAGKCSGRVEEDDAADHTQLVCHSPSALPWFYRAADHPLLSVWDTESEGRRGNLTQHTQPAPESWWTEDHNRIIIIIIVLKHYYWLNMLRICTEKTKQRCQRLTRLVHTTWLMCWYSYSTITIDSFWVSASVNLHVYSLSNEITAADCRCTGWCLQWDLLLPSDTLFLFQSQKQRISENQQ